MYTIICFINLFLVFFCNIFKGFEMINIFKIITYLQNIISIPHISSYLKSDMVPKDEPHRDNFNKISFFNKNLFFFFYLFHLFHNQNRRYTLHNDFESKERF